MSERRSAFASGAGSAITFSNSVVSGLCDTSSDGEILSTGGNVESTGHSCGFSLSDDADDVAAVTLALLAAGDHGGSTATSFFGAGSPAIDGAHDADCLLEDQRGAARPVAGCDSGAVEAESVAPATPIFADGFLQGDTEAWSDTVPPL